MSGDTVDVVARLKRESEVPLRSHGSLSMHWALMAAGLVAPADVAAAMRDQRACDTNAPSSTAAVR